MRVKKILWMWFSTRGLVTRRDYLLSGFGLAFLKYVLDGLAVYFSTGAFLMPLQFLSPLFQSRSFLLDDGRSPTVLVVMALWALVFLWIGVSMSVRRAIDADLSPWLGLLFVFPLVNFGLIAFLSIRPSRPSVRGWSNVAVSSQDAVRSALLGALAGAMIALSGTALSVLALKSYGSMLFFATPFVMGAVAAYVHNATRPRTVASTLGVVLMSTLVAGGAILMFALEGALCLLMAAPLAGAAAFIGGLLGRSIACMGGLAARRCLAAIGICIHRTSTAISGPAAESFDSFRWPGDGRGSKARRGTRSTSRHLGIGSYGLTRFCMTSTRAFCVMSPRFRRPPWNRPKAVITTRWMYRVRSRPLPWLRDA